MHIIFSQKISRLSSTILTWLIMILFALSGPVTAQSVSGFGESTSDSRACREAIYSAQSKCRSRKTDIQSFDCYCTNGSNMQERQCSVRGQCIRNSPARPSNQSSINVLPAKWHVGHVGESPALVLDTKQFELIFFCGFDGPTYFVAMRKNNQFRDRLLPNLKAIEALRADVVTNFEPTQLQMKIIDSRAEMQGDFGAITRSRWINLKNSPVPEHARSNTTEEDGWAYYVANADVGFNSSKVTEIKEFLNVVKNARLSVSIQFNPVKPEMAFLKYEEVRSSGGNLAVYGHYSAKGSTRAVKEFLEKRPYCLQ